MQNPFVSGYGQWPGGAAPGVPDYPYSTQPPVSYPGLTDSTQSPMMGARKGKKPGLGKGPFAMNPAISTKNQLQEYAQHQGLPFPFYCTRAAPGGEKSGWVSVVNFNGTEYSVDVPAGGKKQAEARAAEAALCALGLVASPDKPVPPTPVPIAAVAPVAPDGPAEMKTKPKSTGKCDLHYFLTSRKIPPAVYSTKEAEGEVKGFVSTVEAAGDKWESVDVMPNKKAAENRAAEMALEVLKLMPEQEKKPSLSSSAENFVLTLLVADPKFKTHLNEYCARRQLPHPIYETEVVIAPSFKGYKATCKVIETVFHSEEGKLYATKKNAEQAAASTAWDSLKEKVASQDASEKAIQAIPYKIILQEHLGRRDLEQPVFTHEKVEGNGFLSECAFEGKTYKSTTPYFNKKTAESEAAKVALEGLGIVNLNKVVERRILKAKRLIGTGFNWRDALMKFFEAKGKKMPEIVVEPKIGRFYAHLLIEGGKRFVCDPAGFQEEESAIQSVSKNTCIALSIPLHVQIPENQANPDGGSPKPTIDVIMDDGMGQEVHVPNAGLKRRLEEWVESRSGQRGVKKARAEEAYAVPKHVLKTLVVVEVWPDKKNVVVVGNESFSCAMLCLNDESNCEISVDGKNVTLQPGMVLEDVEAVFKYIPYCGGITLLANQCARVSQATASTSPVVTGAGVVILAREDDAVKVLLKRYKTSMAFIPASQELSFALRRAGTVWDDFSLKGRKKIPQNRENAKKPVDAQKVVEKIHLWTNEEVDAVRKMTTESMKSLFSVTKWKWLDRWDAILQRKTKTELREYLKKQREERLDSGNQKTADEEENPPHAEKKDDDGDSQADGEDDQGMEADKPEKEANGDASLSVCADDAQVADEVEDNVPLLAKFGFDEVARLAEEEFQRRQGLGEGSLDELVLRPWGFPKGGFRHQALSTGIHLETAAECARRELKEECGISLKLPDVEQAEKVIVLCTDADNLNPHKGDANVYFLHEVDPSVSNTAGKPIQDVMDITRNPVFHPRVKTFPFQKKKLPPVYRQHHLLRQKEVHEEFTWFSLEEAAALTPIFNYIMTTNEFRNFAKLPPAAAEETKPTPASPARAVASPVRPAARRGRR